VVLRFAPVAVQDSRAKFAVAFVMGFLGLKGLEFVVEKWFGKKVDTKPAKRKNSKPRKGKG
jgi:hypothetical protein